MNKDRRKALADIVDTIDGKFRSLIEEITTDIENIRDEEQDYYDNMPESFQDGEKGERAQEAINRLEEVIELFNDFDLSEAIDGLNTAAE